MLYKTEQIQFKVDSAIGNLKPNVMCSTGHIWQQKKLCLFMVVVFRWIFSLLNFIFNEPTQVCGVRTCVPLQFNSIISIHFGIFPFYDQDDWYVPGRFKSPYNILIDMFSC